MPHRTPHSRAPRAALITALATAGLLGGVPAAQAAVTLSYPGGDNELTATSDGAGDTIIVRDASTPSLVAVQVPGMTVDDPDGAGTACSASGDTVECRASRAVLVGNGGNDVLTDTATVASRYGDVSPPLLDGGPGDDTLTGGVGSDVFAPGAGADIVRGGSAPTDPAAEPYKSFLADGGDPAVFQRDYGFQDRVTYPPDGQGVTVTLDDRANDGAPGEGDDIGSDIESVVGTAGNDTLTAGASGVSFFGLLGDDVLNGGAASDQLYGGGGEGFFGSGDGAGSDALNGNGGDDTLTDDDASPYFAPYPGEPARTPAGSDTLNGGDGNDVIATGEGADDVIGGPGRDEAVGFSRFGRRPLNAPDDYVNPRLGFTISLDGVANDGVTGAGEGDNVHPDVESVTTGGGDDVVTGGSGPDELLTGAGNDTVTGGGGADVIEAGAGDDTLRVQDGITDRADGGRGNDSAVADLGGGQPEKADVLFNVESITGTPLPSVIDATKIPVTPATPPNTAPKVAVSGSTFSSKAFLKAGSFTLKVTTDEPAAVVADLLAKSRFRAVGDLVIGTGRGGLATGTRKVKVSVGASNLKSFKRKLRTKAQKKAGIALRVRIVATDALGLPTTVTKTVKIKG